MKKITTVIVFFVACLTATLVFAIDADLYSLDDFIDPRILGYDFDDDSGSSLSRGDDLALTNFRFGNAHNYQQREIFTEANSEFGQFDIFYYYNAMQAGYRYHRFNSDIDEAVSQEWHKVFFGVYHLYGDELPVSRYMLTYEQSEVDGKDVDEYGLDLDLALEDPLFSFDIDLALPDTVLSLKSGLSFKRREQEGDNETRILLRYAIYNFIYDRMSLRSSLGVAEVAGEWDWAITKLALTAYHPIPGTSMELHAYYSFAYRPERTNVESESNNEVGVFINIPLFL